MALLQDDNLKSEQGFSKTIDEAGLGMVMDNLQRYQYQYPIKSTVRETASNGVDSIRERDIAKSILLGQSLVSDYYVEKEGALFEASKFNPEYYNLDYLSDDTNFHIVYLERENQDRDLLRFVDHGVGLGGNRLEGFFNLSYSTKRLSKSALGKFGIGAKAPLSTGVPSYRMISIYNGQKYIFDIFSRHIQSLVDKWDHEGVDNLHHVFANGYSFYSEATTEKNGVTIELEVKKHQRSAYREAVQNQLLYFNNVDFEIIHDSNEEAELEEDQQSYKDVIPVTTKIVFENEDFIISNNNLFSKPHLVLGAEGSMVNYGLIDFKELELEPRTGNIGIKVDGSDIEITPSRESVVWSPKTRDVILGKFKKALEEAESIVSSQLQDTDFLNWIDKNVSLWSSTAGTNPVLRQLSGMIDKTAIKSVYSVDPTIVYDSPKKMLGQFGSYRQTTFESKYTNGSYKYKVTRTEVNSWVNPSGINKIFFTTGQISNRKDSYIRSFYNCSVFNSVLIPEITDDVWIAIKQTLVDRVNAQKESQLDLDIESSTDWDLMYEGLLAEKVAAYDKIQTFLKYAKESTLYVDYDAIVIPNDWLDNTLSQSNTETGLENLSEIKPIYETINHSLRRKKEGRVFFKYAGFKTPYDHRYIYKQIVPSTSNNYKAIFSWTQKEEFASTLNDFDGTLVYGIQSSTEDGPNDELLLKMVAGMLLNTTGIGPMATTFDKENGITNEMISGKTYSLYPSASYDDYVGTNDLMLLKVSKILSKDLVNFIPINKFLRDIDENNKIFIHMKLINWFTAKQIYSILQKLQFLRNFSEISSHHAKEWEQLYSLTNQYYFDGMGRLSQYPTELQESYISSLDSLYKFQRWITEDSPSIEEIGERSVIDFGVPATDAHVVDLPTIYRAEKLLEWAEPIVDLLNNVGYFTTPRNVYLNDKTDKEEFLESIRYYLRSKSTPMIDFVEVTE